MTDKLLLIVTIIAAAVYSFLCIVCLVARQWGLVALFGFTTIYVLRDLWARAVRIGAIAAERQAAELELAEAERALAEAEQKLRCIVEAGRAAEAVEPTDKEAKP